MKRLWFCYCMALAELVFGVLGEAHAETSKINAAQTSASGVAPAANSSTAQQALVKPSSNAVAAAASPGTPSAGTGVPLVNGAASAAQPPSPPVSRANDTATPAVSPSVAVSPSAAVPPSVAVPPSAAKSPAVASSAAQPSAPPTNSTSNLPVEREPHRLEITFGSGQLFFTRSVEQPSGNLENKIVPVTAALVMAEWLFHPRLSVTGLFNLPLETQTTVANGKTREEYVAPAFALGVRGSLFSFAFFRESAMELQLALLGGRTFGSRQGDHFFPMIAARLHFHTESGFTLYLGNGFAFAQNTHVLIYGIGHRF